jgi:hypothetical protein
VEETASGSLEVHDLRRKVSHGAEDEEIQKLGGPYLATLGN